MENNIPRRIRIDLFTEAEKAIYDAVQKVEMAGADVRLTDAVCLLSDARKLVADFVDGIQAVEKPLSVNQVGKLRFTKAMPEIMVTVKGVHTYKDKIKYDLALWLAEGYEPRIYNVDSVFVVPA